MSLLSMAGIEIQWRKIAIFSSYFILFFCPLKRHSEYRIEIRFYIHNLVGFVNLSEDHVLTWHPRNSERWFALLSSNLLECHF